SRFSAYSLTAVSPRFSIAASISLTTLRATPLSVSGVLLAFFRYCTRRSLSSRGAHRLRRARHCRPGCWLALPQPHHRLDLHLHARNRQLAYADQGARGTCSTEELLAHGIDLAAVVDVEEIHRDFEDVGEARARRVEHPLHVLEHL